MAERIYFQINESMAKTAHDMMSMSDYKEGSKTAEYMRYADKAYDLAEKIEKERPKQAERAWSIATAYARRMADNLNTDSRIGTRCPSVLVSGAGNFPTKKKERQVAAWESNHEEFQNIQKYIARLENILYGKEIIKSADEDAIILLEEKCSKLEAIQAEMKEVNAYYRKHKTLDGCPELSPEQIEELKAEMEKPYHYCDKPYSSYLLTNNGANIRRIKKRIETLKQEKENGSTEHDREDLGIVVKENTEDMRIQLFFEGKPEPEIRDILKHHAFKWSPKNQCWQRQLTNNSRYATRSALDEIAKLKEATA